MSMENISSHKKNMQIKIAYVHAMEFPCPEANAFDAVWTASALSEKVDTTFFMPSLSISKKSMRQFYDISPSSLRLQSMYLDFIPDRFLIRFPNYYEQILAFYLHYHPDWVGFHGQKVLYARHPRQLLFWGLQRARGHFWKEWTLCYESHDPLGLDPNKFRGANPFELKDGQEGQYRQSVLRAAMNFDFIITNTQVQTDDLHSWTNNALKTHFITLASPLPRLPSPPQVQFFGEKVILGYIGTVDQYRGVNILLEAMRFLPERYTLRIVGRLRQELGAKPDWLNVYMRDPQIGPKVDLNIVDSISDVAAEIDRCDFVVQPASGDVLDSRYTAPLKSYGYMVRGKPIIAGDVPCHRELFQDGKAAMLYRLDPKSFAESVIYLVNNPELAERIARNSWEQSADFNFHRRADDILSLVRCTTE